MNTWNDKRITDGDVRPPPPSSGIPPQRLPVWIRRVIQVVVLPFVVLDVWIQTAAMTILPMPYKRVGHCQKTGNCCKYLIQQRSKAGDVFRLFHWWTFEVNGFYERGFEVDSGDDLRYRVFSCRHLSNDGRCQNYRFRPTICRMWPKVNFWGPSSILKGCGYQLVPKSKTTDASLIQISRSPSQSDTDHHPSS